MNEPASQARRAFHTNDLRHGHSRWATELNVGFMANWELRANFR